MPSTAEPSSEDPSFDQAGTRPGHTVRLDRWDGPIADDDPDANFKQDVALFTQLDPLTTITNLARALDLPVGAVCRYVLAKWASAGSEALLALGPSAVQRLWSEIEQAEVADTDEARLAAFDVVRQQLAWLKVPLDDPASYPDPGSRPER